MTHSFTSRGLLRNPLALIFIFLIFAFAPVYAFSNEIEFDVIIEVSDGPGAPGASWTLFDADGVEVVSGGAPATIPMTLPVGMYYIELVDDDGGYCWLGSSDDFVNFQIYFGDPLVAYISGGYLNWSPPVVYEGNVATCYRELPFFHWSGSDGCDEGMEVYQGMPYYINGWENLYDFDTSSLTFQRLLMEAGPVMTNPLAIDAGFFQNLYPDECCGEWSPDCQEVYDNIRNYYFPNGEPTPHPEIIPAEVFNDSRVFANLGDGEYTDDMDCAVADIGQNHLWYKFTAGHTNSLVSARREGGGNFNGVIEIYEGWQGPQIVCQDDYTGANEVAVFPTEIGETYFIKVYHNGASALTNGDISVGVAFVPQAELRDLDCGTMDITDATIIRSNWPSNQWLLQNWMFEFTELEPPYNVYEVLSPNGSNPQFRWFWFPEREPGRTYSVRTKARMYQGPTWADYGDACIIGTAEVADTPPSGLITNQGGMTSTPGELGLQLWPNPAQGEVNISFAPGVDDSHADIIVLDISGKEIERIQHSFDRGRDQVIRYDSNTLSPGIYMFHIQTASATATGRLVVTQQ